MSRTMDVATATTRYHLLDSGTEPDDPSSLLFTTDRILSDDDIARRGQIIGYAWRATLAGESLPAPVRRGRTCFTIEVDSTKSRRSDVPAAWDDFIHTVGACATNGTPIRQTNRAGAGTKGTRLVEGVPGGVGLDIWADSVIGPPDEVQVAAAALDAFWAKVAELVPRARTGDLPPVVQERFTRIAEQTVRSWIASNT